MYSWFTEVGLDKTAYLCVPCEQANFQIQKIRFHSMNKINTMANVIIMSTGRKGGQLFGCVLYMCRRPYTVYVTRHSKLKVGVFPPSVNEKVDMGLRLCLDNLHK